MVDLKSQLGDYFDHVVQHVDVEDVLERRLGSEPVRPIQPRMAPSRPRWGAVAAGFVVALLAVGGVGLLLRGGNVSRTEAVSTAPSTTAVPPTTVSPVTTTATPGGSAVPSGWCGVGSPPESVNWAGDESVAWAPDGSKWGIMLWPSVELRQTLPDGSVISHPLPTIEDFEPPPWVGRVDGVGDLTRGDLEVTTDGQVYWLTSPGGWVWIPYGVLRYDPESSTWENIEMVPGRTVPVSGIEATCDGSLWALVIDWTMGDDGEALEGWWLAHIDANGVTTRIDVDLPPGTVPEAAFSDHFSSPPPDDLVDGPPMVILADDRAVWLMNGGDVPTVGRGVFSGVARYDGEEWTRFLDGELVLGLTLNDDGTATADLLLSGGMFESVLIEP